MGDNIIHNQAIARDLKLTQGHCQAHALALVVKNSFKLIPDLESLTVTASSIQSAGGTNKRVVEMSNAPYLLDPRKMKCYTNRFV